MKVVMLCLAIVLSYALLVVADENTTVSDVANTTVTSNNSAVTTELPKTSTSGYSIVLPSVMVVGAANILQRFF